MARLGGIDTQYFDNEGFPLSRGRLYCYETGTYTPKGTFHDSALTVPNEWPIELDAIGVPPDVFFTGTARFILCDSSDTVLRECDPVIDNEFQAGDTIILRLGDIDSQFFDQNGEILALGKLYLYENGTSTPKDTYSDNALTTLNPWPVVLGSTGFLGDVFFEGKARLVLTDQYGVQQRELDDVDTFDISYLPGFLVACPESASYFIGEGASFCVDVTGDPSGYTYQWYQDLSLLVGETGQCFYKLIDADDDGTSIWVTVSDGASTEQCGYAAITVTEVPPWVCSAYEDALNFTLGTALEGDKTYAKTYMEDTDTPPMDWPFSVDEGVDGKFIVYNNYIPGAVDFTTWSGGDPQATCIVPDYFTETVTDAAFCNGELTGMAAINGPTVSGGGGNFCIISPSSVAVDKTDAWGDTYVSCLIMGHDIGHATNAISGGLLHGTAKNWTFTRNGVTYNQMEAQTCGVTASTSGNDVTIELFITQDDSYLAPPITTSFTVIGAATELNLLQIAIESTAPFEAASPTPGGTNVYRTVTITCYYAGTTATLTGDKNYQNFLYGSAPLTGITPYINVGANGIYAYSRIFRGAKLNLAALLIGKLTGTADLSEIMAREQAAWALNKP